MSLGQIYKFDPEIHGHISTTNGLFEDKFCIDISGSQDDEPLKPSVTVKLHHANALKDGVHCHNYELLAKH